jgi:uncharacterized phiE125 gp8 family phage protein
MTGYPKLVTGPAVEPMTTAEAKTHLRVDFSDDDAYIDTLIVAARVALENETNRKLITQTWDLYMDRVPSSLFAIPFGSLQSVSSIKYVDSDAAETVVSSSVYDVVTWEDPGRVVLAYSQTWPAVTLRTAGGFIVRFVCGYGDASTDIPEPLIQAMKLTIGHLYENREQVVVGQGVTVAELPAAATALAWPYRILSV